MLERIISESDVNIFIEWVLLLFGGLVNSYIVEGSGYFGLGWDLK